MENGVLHQRYCEEVLGLQMFPATATQPAVEKLPLLVDCEELTGPSKALLQKIMGSIGVKDWATEGAAHHIFKFSGLGPREERDGMIVWNLPTLSEMLGDSPEVAARKKAAWTLLKQAQLEIKPK